MLAYDEAQARILWKEAIMTPARRGSLAHRHADGTAASIPLRQDVTTLGRSAACAVVIPSPTVSLLHARVELLHGRYMLFDAESANGTFVNGRRITQGYRLRTGDEIWLGSPDVSLGFADPEETLAFSPVKLLAPLCIDEDARTVHVYGVDVPLSPPEYRLLVYLANNPGTVCTHAACGLVVWGQAYEHVVYEHVLDACISRLCYDLAAAARSVAQPAVAIMIVPQVGFRLDAEVVFGPHAELSIALQEHLTQG